MGEIDRRQRIENGVESGQPSMNPSHRLASPSVRDQITHQ
ncbi:hypothetical protein NJ7G_0055 [Natrinema sp. J7-2]|nr:hypothetical protein NJ7G_0055 [Natrinema sp. J7-2]